MIDYTANNPISAALGMFNNVINAKNNYDQMNAMKALYANYPTQIANQNALQQQAVQGGQDRLNYLPAQLATALQGSQLSNQNQAIANQWAGPMDAARYQNQLITNQYAPGLDQATIRNSLTNQQTANTSQNRNSYMQSPIYLLNKQLMAMPSAQRSAWLGANANQYNSALSGNMNDVLGLIYKLPSNNQGGQTVQNNMQQTVPSVQPQLQQPMVNQAAPYTQQQSAPGVPVNPVVTGNMMAAQPAVNASQMQPNLNAPQIAAQGNSQGVLPPVQTLQVGNSPQGDLLKTAYETAANNSLTTSKTRTQLEGAIGLDTYLTSPQLQRQIYNAAQYAGAIGKGKAFADALSQQNPQAYEDYLTVKNDILPTLANRIKTTEGMSSVFAQRPELLAMVNGTADSFTSNPDQFVTQMNNLASTFRDVTGSLLNATNKAFPVQPNIPQYNPIPLPSKNPNWTSGVQAQRTIPTFSNKQEAIQWYASLTPAQREQYRNSGGQ